MSYKADYSLPHTPFPENLQPAIGGGARPSAAIPPAADESGQCLPLRTTEALVQEQGPL